MISLGNKLRLSKKYENEIRQLAARQGNVVGSVKTPDAFIEASLMTMDDQTLQMMDELLESVLDK